MDISLNITSVSGGTSSSPPHSPTVSSTTLETVLTNINNVSTITTPPTITTTTSINIPTDLSEFTIQETGITIQGNSSGINLSTYSPVVPQIVENLRLTVEEIKNCSRYWKLNILK